MFTTLILSSWIPSLFHFLIPFFLSGCTLVSIVFIQRVVLEEEKKVAGSTFASLNQGWTQEKGILWSYLHSGADQLENYFSFFCGMFQYLAMRHIRGRFVNLRNLIPANCDKTHYQLERNLMIT